MVLEGSKDGSAEIAYEFVEQYPDTLRIIYKANGGHGSAINTGLMMEMCIRDRIYSRIKNNYSYENVALLHSDSMSMYLKEFEEKMCIRDRDKQGYSFKTQILIYAVISGSFSVFFGGDVNDMIASALIGIALKLFCLLYTSSFLRSSRNILETSRRSRRWRSSMTDRLRWLTLRSLQATL